DDLTLDVRGQNPRSRAENKNSQQQITNSHLKEKLQSNEALVYSGPCRASGLNTVEKVAFCKNPNVCPHEKTDGRNHLNHIPPAVGEICLLEPECRHDPRQYQVLRFAHDGTAVRRARRRTTQFVRT